VREPEFLDDLVWCTIYWKHTCYVVLLFQVQEQSTRSDQGRL